MAVSVEELSKMLDGECSRCGCTGLHACIGHRPAPITPEEQARLEATLDKIFRRVADEEWR